MLGNVADDGGAERGFSAIRDRRCLIIDCQNTVSAGSYGAPPRPTTTTTEDSGKTNTVEQIKLINTLGRRDNRRKPLETRRRVPFRPGPLLADRVTDRRHHRSGPHPSCFPTTIGRTTVCCFRRANVRISVTDSPPPPVVRVRACSPVYSVDGVCACVIFPVPGVPQR